MRQPTSSGRFSKMPPQLAVRLHYFRRHEGRERKTDSKPNGPSLIGPFEALYPGWIAVSASIPNKIVLMLAPCFQSMSPMRRNQNRRRRSRQLLESGHSSDRLPTASPHGPGTRRKVPFQAEHNCASGVAVAIANPTRQSESGGPYKPFLRSHGRVRLMEFAQDTPDG